MKCVYEYLFYRNDRYRNVPMNIGMNLLVIGYMRNILKQFSEFK